MDELKALVAGGLVHAPSYSKAEMQARSGDERIHPQKRLFTPFLIDKRPPPIPTAEERIQFPFRQTNIFSETFYLWCLPILGTGYRRTIQPEDLYEIKKGSLYDVERRTETFLKYFYNEKNKCEQKRLLKLGLEDTPANRDALRLDPEFSYPRHMTLKALYFAYFRDYNGAVLFKALGDLGAGLNTLQIRHLINYVNDKAEGKKMGNNGYGLAVGMAILVLFVGIMYAHFFNDASFCGAEIKGVLTKVLLDKSFRLNREAKRKFPASNITALLGNDLSKIDLATNYFPFIVTLFVGLGITITLLCINLGGASLSGVAWFCLITLMIVFATRPLMGWRKGANVYTDARVKALKEVLGNMKMIKYYAWETPFKRIIGDLRFQEMSTILRIQVVRNIITGVAVSLPMVSAMIGFLAMYGQFGGLKSAANIFSSVTLFNILTLHVAMLPTALSSAGDAWVAFYRVQEYLLAEEEVPDPDYHKLPYEPKKPAISLKNTTFMWEDGEPEMESSISAAVDSSTEKGDSLVEKEFYSGVKFKLSNINLNVEHGEFIVITGSIGSGKSSLLSAIQGSMPRIAGTIEISGTSVLCAQPWIQNTTVRNNISFGLDFDHKAYDKVVDVCALESDFDILPAGDQTEIGERGVNLSGGQKARINLARAVYRSNQLDEVNIIMFDDVLSAVDAKVGKHIMNECILGLLKNKTRILATHQLSLIGSADRIIYLDSNSNFDIGTQEELIERNEGFKTLMQFQMETKDKEQEDAEDQQVKKLEAELIKKQTTIIDDTKGKLIEKEQVKANGIPKKLIWEYLKSGCGRLGPYVLLGNLIMAITLTSFCMLFQNVWLSFWSTDKFKGKTDGFYIGIYVMMTICFVMCAIWQFCTVVYITNRSSKVLNIKALNKIMHAPMAFFDTTPMGRIINRFTKDTDVLDNEVAEQCRLCCQGLGNMVGVVIMCIIFLPWFAITVPFIVGYLFLTFGYYQATAREVKRLEGVSRSLVFSNFDEVLHGMDTIKLYECERQFMAKNCEQINSMNESYLLSVSLQRWFAISLHGCSATLNVIISMLCVSRAYPISAAASGLIISYLVQFSMQITSFSKSMGQIEQQLSSVERVCEYATELVQEAPYEGAGCETVRPSWPEQGHIVLKDVSLRYRPELPFVLKNMTIDIKPGEKVGICGRTGAGKSTIMTALYRLSEAEGGTMLIDGVDIQKIGLFDLRSKLSIIPQDPILFHGTVRSNLDPFGQLDDATLNRALMMSCGDTEFHNPNTKFQLDSHVDHEGGNFSLGERQVLALCRALVRDSKILILDEATSSVDYETDARIQRTIAAGFEGCTILCIAHRLKTIINYDKILVMDKGEGAEFAAPLELWEQGGIFRQMCDKGGVVRSDFE